MYRTFLHVAMVNALLCKSLYLFLSFLRICHPYTSVLFLQIFFIISCFTKKQEIQWQMKRLSFV